MKQITAHQLASFRAGRRASDADCLRVRIPPSGVCVRCQEAIPAQGAHPTRMGYWLCPLCIQPGEGWTDVREANYEIFQKGVM